MDVDGPQISYSQRSLRSGLGQSTVGRCAPGVTLHRGKCHHIFVVPTPWGILSRSLAIPQRTTAPESTTPRSSAREERRKSVQNRPDVKESV